VRTTLINVIQPPGRMACSLSCQLYTEPNPRVISRDLLARREFIPAPTVNVLLAAWLQFMVHDWLSHGFNDRDRPPHSFPVPPGDDWPKREMTILRTGADKQTGPADEGRPATFRNIVTAWWDGSQIYGSDLKMQHCLRSGPSGMLPNGKLQMDETGHLPIDPEAADDPDPELELAGVNGNWWIGLSAMHTLFNREHNAIVDRLRAEYPDKDGEWLFQKARLINSALIVKIHATEWTPALLQSPELQYAMRASWWGTLGDAYFKAFGRPLRRELLSGIPNSPQDHYAAPYSITEEFTAVYRLHSLIPDEFSFRRRSDDSEVHACTLADLFAGGTTRVNRKVAFEDVLYSLGTSHPGAPVLHNFPNHLRKIPEKREQNAFTDLAATDILRDRERGVPRYCAFRRMLRMRAPKSFAELTDNKEWQRELEAIYGDVERVDLLTGTLAEPKPPGFAISDTGFRIFIVMAGRRIKRIAS
jgi:Animal haem peroxidase